jgi:hypothetical protein
MRSKKLVALGLCGVLVSSLSACTNKDVTSDNIASASNLGEAVDLGENKAIVDTMSSMVDGMFTEGAYFNLIVSDIPSENLIFIYNKDKDCYAETLTGCPIYYDAKGNVRMYTDPYTDQKDVSPLILAQNALEFAKHGKAEVAAGKVNVKDIYENILEDVKESRAAEESSDTAESVEAEEVTESTEDVEESTEAVAESTEEVTESTEGVTAAVVDEGNSVEVESTLSAEEEAAAILGYDLEKVETAQYDELVVTIPSRESLVSLYGMTVGDAEAKKIVDAALDGDEDPSDDDKFLFTYHYSEDGMFNGVMMEAQLTETEAYTFWMTDGVLNIGGDWKGMPDDWYTKESVDDVKNDILRVIDNVEEAITKFKDDNFTEEELKEMEETYSETVEETVGGSEANEDDPASEVGAAKPENEVDSIVRTGSFKETIDGLLANDGLSGVDNTTFKVPDGYTDADKERMIRLYTTLLDWDAKQQDGTLISPISPDDVDFATKYIEKCEEQFTEAETDECGTVFWKDTVGVFLKAIQ